jgi:deoxyxylulose-5-phosphate synthase
MNAAEIAAKASDLVGGDRAKQHGDKSENFAKIAAIWNGTLAAAGVVMSRPLDGHDVCNLMETMKVARRYTGSFNVDDYIDGAGYAACAGEVLAQQTAADKSWAEAANS